MNICFFRGKIISKIEFKFVMKNDVNLSSKHTSICYFDVLLNNNTIIKIKAHDDLADLCYRNLEENYFINICGKLYQNYEVELIEFEVYL